MKYLVAVKIQNITEIFEFDCKESQDSFIKELKKLGIEYIKTVKKAK